MGLNKCCGMLWNIREVGPVTLKLRSLSNIRGHQSVHRSRVPIHLSFFRSPFCDQCGGRSHVCCGLCAALRPAPNAPRGSDNPDSFPVFWQPHFLEVAGAPLHAARPPPTSSSPLLLNIVQLLLRWVVYNINAIKAGWDLHPIHATEVIGVNDAHSSVSHCKMIETIWVIVIICEQIVGAFRKSSWVWYLQRFSPLFL